MLLKQEASIFYYENFQLALALLNAILTNGLHYFNEREQD